MDPAAVAFDSLARILAAGLVALRQPDERIAEALRDGLSVRQAAELLNVSTITVRRVQLERRP